MGLDIYFKLIRHPRKRRENESLDKYYESIDKKEDKVFKKETREFIESNIAAMDEENAEYLSGVLHMHLLDKYFKYEWELEPLKTAKTVDDVRKWYDGIDWEIFYKPSVGYFRKVNSVYSYFSDRLEDEMCEVYRSDLVSLISKATTVLDRRDRDVSRAILPTTGGFFFGGTDYDDNYYKYQAEAIIIECAKMLSEWTDDKDRMFVLMSW